MIRTLLTFVCLAAAFSTAAYAAANQVACSPSFPASIAYGDDVTNCQLSQVGQVALLTFNGNAGDDITIVVTASWSAPCIGLYDPTNTEIGSDACGNTFFGFTETNYSYTLMMTGRYTIRIHDAGYDHTGTFALMLNSWSPAAVASPLTLGVTATGTTVNIETIDDWTFSGTTGEDFTVQVNSSYSAPCFTLVGPGGVTVGSACANTFFGYTQVMGEYTLPAGGIYVVQVYSSGYGEKGTYSMLAQCLGSCPTASAPAITGLTPNSAAAGGPLFTLTVNGSGFLSGAAVQWNGVALATIYVNGNQLTATVPASDITTSGSVSVTVANPGGSVSNGAMFTITPPPPNISSLSPSSATVGGPGFTLTVNGSGFLSGSAVQWNGSTLVTNYVSANQLTASVQSTLIDAAAGVSITVVNPSGAVSNAAAFPIISPALNPAISGLSPSSTTAGGAGFTLTVNGSEFLSGAVVQWNSSALVTTYVSENELTATVPSSNVATPGSVSIVVANPGGAASSAATFIVNPPGIGKPIVLLTRYSDDATVDYFSNLLTKAGLPFTQLTATEVNANSVANAILIAGFSAEPTEYQAVANVITTAVNNGSWLICEAYGMYLPSYAGVGSVNTSITDPVALDTHAFVAPVPGSGGPVFGGIQTWDPPSLPDRPAQYLWYYLQTFGHEILTYAPPTNAVASSFWDLTLTYGWGGQYTGSSYCQTWGGCSGERSVLEVSLYQVAMNNGAIVVGPTDDGIVTGYLSYGPVLDTIHLNAIQMAKGLPASGSFDIPINNQTGLSGAVNIGGWALSTIPITVQIWRDPVSGETAGANGLVYIQNTAFVAGARPDIAAAYPGYFNSNAAGWGAQLLTNELPNSSGTGPIGNGTYTLHALVTDANGAITDLGGHAITVNNAGSSTPFGTIDTPADGAIISGAAYINFGWALTPQPNNIPVNGSTIWVFIDGVPMGHPVYNNPRSDIQALFPGYANTNGAIGYFYINTTTLVNGLHTISWSITDNAGNANGIGSRYFTVQN